MSRWATYGIWFAVALGVFFRTYHYARQPAVWHDEAAVLVNVVKLDFAQMAGPLHFHEAAPLLFLWLERALFLTCGDHVLVLRLPAFLASCLSLPLLVLVARRWLSEPATFWVVALFACCEKCAWHACEAKPYALDVFCTLVVLALYARLDHLPLSRRCLLHAAVAPLLLTLSYPACFVHGGLVLALLVEVWDNRSRGAIASFALLNVVIVATFFGVVMPVAQAQHDPVIHSDWTRFFPDWHNPLAAVGWAVVNTLEVMRYCLHPHGQLLILPLGIGAVVWWRQGERAQLLLCLAPLGLALVAAGLHRYPFGGSRVQMYAAPLILVVSGIGLEAALRHARVKAAWIPLGVAGYLLLITCHYANRRLAEPWPRADTPAACAWICAEAQPGDPIRGNDWTHNFYLHQRDADFAFLPRGDEPAAAQLWLLWTEQTEAAVRFQRLQANVPPGWEVAEKRDFEAITVVRLRRVEREALAHND